MPVRATSSSLVLDERLSRLRHLWREPLALPGFELFEPRRSTIDSGGHAATVSNATIYGDRAAALLSCFSGGIRTGPPSNTSRSAPPTVRSTIERSSKAPLALTSIHPNPASQQRRAGREEPLAVGTVLRRGINVKYIRARQRCPGIGTRTVRRWWNAASRGPRRLRLAAPSPTPARSHRAAAARPRRRPASPWCQSQAMRTPDRDRRCWRRYGR